MNDRPDKRAPAQLPHAPIESAGWTGYRQLEVKHYPPTVGLAFEPIQLKAGLWLLKAMPDGEQGSGIVFLRVHEEDTFDWNPAIGPTLYVDAEPIFVFVPRYLWVDKGARTHVWIAPNTILYCSLLSTPESDSSRDR